MSAQSFFNIVYALLHRSNVYKVSINVINRHYATYSVAGTNNELYCDTRNGRRGDVNIYMIVICIFIYVRVESELK